MIIFVTGFHRAGTHSFAEKLSKELNRPWFEEGVIRWDSFKAVEELCKSPNLTDGFVLQCPGLAHKTLELARRGKVYWLVRSRLDLITSMRNAGMDVMLWHLMKGFNSEFPDDPIWQAIKYDGPEDNHFGFVKYKALFCSVKDYFYRKHFKNICEEVVLEKQDSYTETLSHRKPLRALELSRAIKDVAYYEGLCLGQA